VERIRLIKAKWAKTQKPQSSHPLGRLPKNKHELDIEVTRNVEEIQI
jgi:hypothetical protein